MNSFSYQIKNWSDFWKKYFLLLLVSTISCQSPPTNTDRIKSISLQQRDSFIQAKLPAKNSQQAIHKILEQVIAGILTEDLTILSEVVHPEKGLYVDLKAKWSYGKLLKELKNPNSYFEIYFFHPEKLAEQKKTKDVETVKQILQRSGGLYMDFFFQDAFSCEVRLNYIKKPNGFSDLNNPYFLFIDGKWYLYRLL